MFGIVRRSFTEALKDSDKKRKKRTQYNALVKRWGAEVRDWAPSLAGCVTQGKYFKLLLQFSYLKNGNSSTYLIRILMRKFM